MKPSDNSYEDLLHTTTVSDDLDRDLRDLPRQEIGRASCRERV